MTRRIIITAALLLLALHGVVFAQTDTHVEFYGTIQSANSTAIVVNGQIVDVRGAVVNTPLNAGVSVRVQASLQTDGNLVAWQIDALPAGVIPGIVEINGIVSGFVVPLLTVNNQIIDTTGRRSAVV